MRNALCKAAWIFFLCLAFFIPLLSAHAADYVLFRGPGKPVRDYNQIVASLKPGDTVRFSDGRVFTIYQLFRGGQNAILDVGNGKVLRIRLERFGLKLSNFFNPFASANNLVDSLGDYLSGYRFLKAHGVDTVRVLPEESLRDEFVAVEKVHPEFDYADFMNEQFREKLPPSKREKVEQDLVRWARSTWSLATIGDFRNNQLVYTSDRGWVLIDWFAGHREAGSTTDNVFEMDAVDRATNRDRPPGVVRLMIHKPGLPTYLQDRVLQAIMEERNLALDRKGCLEKIVRKHARSSRAESSPIGK